MVLNGRFQGPQTMLLAFQTEPKWSKSEVQERCSSKWAAGGFKRLSRTPKDKKRSPFWEAIFVNFCYKIVFIHIFWVTYFVLIFGIAFKRPPDPIWKDFDVILGSIFV